jgi:hypothetical protein
MLDSTALGRRYLIRMGELHGLPRQKLRDSLMAVPVAAAFGPQGLDWRITWHREIGSERWQQPARSRRLG